MGKYRNGLSNMPLIDPPETGYVSAKAAADELRMQRSQFYASGLADWLDHWMQGNSRMYSKRQLAQMRYWLDVRAGQIALGVISPTSPLIIFEGKHELSGFVEDDLWGGECQECGGFCVVHPDTSEAWCKQCHVRLSG